MAAPKTSKPKRKSSAPLTGQKGGARADRRVMVEEPYAFQEIIAIIMGGVCVMFLLSLVSYTARDLPSWVPFSQQSDKEHVMQNFVGPVGAVVAGYAYFFFGAATYLVPAIGAWWTIQVIRGGRPFNVRNFAAFGMLITAAACLTEFQGWFFQDWTGRYNLPKSAGGFFGYLLGVKVIGKFLGSVGSVIVVSIVYTIALIVITGVHPLRFAALLREEAVAVFSRVWDYISEWLSEKKAEAGARQRSSQLTRAPRESVEPRSKRVSKPAEKGRATEPEQLEMFSDVDVQASKTLGAEPKIIDSSQTNKKRLSPEEAAASLFEKKQENQGVLSGGQFPDYKLPSLNLLQYSDEEDMVPTDQSLLIEQQENIVNTLATFGVDVEPGDITKGPAITRYELYPAPGLRVNKITSLQADIARATCAERINILAPVPGKDTVGIEIANSDRIPVALRELFEDEAFRNTKAKLPLALGKDVYGRTIVGDLARMPHLLVAGATGSGKSVCINSIIASLLYRFTPDELRFIMVDPKVVEMQIYNDLPHMVVPVVTDPKKVLLALRWVINEMERRYALFAKVGTRNFEGFNSLRARDLAAQMEADQGDDDEFDAAYSTEDGLLNGDELDFPPFDGGVVMDEPELVHHVRISDDLNREEFPEINDGDILFDRTAPAASAAAKKNDELPESLPYIVVIIDELADLMQTAPADVETGIARIAQKARAAGIHLIVATQTPRADVVTGIIKANIPSRIAFQVSSKTDSRIILDANGAENLVGKGDMLYLPPGTASLIRSQGALITDEEAQALVEACASQGQARYEQEAQDAIESGMSDGDMDEISDADEETLERCLEVVYLEKKASTSLLQRKLRLGYTRAARMMDILESRGIIGPGEGAKPREILIDLSDDFE